MYIVYHCLPSGNLTSQWKPWPISVLSHSKWRFRWFSVARMFNFRRAFILIHSKSLTALTVIHNYASLFPSGFSIIIYNLYNVWFNESIPNGMAFHIIPYRFTNIQTNPSLKWPSTTRILLMNLFWMVGLFNPVTDHSYGRVLAHTLPYLGLQHLGRREVLTESVRMGFPWKHRLNICIICNHVCMYIYIWEYYIYIYLWI